MLELKQVTAGYGKIDVLRGVSLEARAGEITALVGPDGAGKSTLLRSISGTVVSAAGSITFKGIPLSGRPPHKIASMGIAHVQEGRMVFGSMSVEENLLMGAYLKDRRGKIKESMAFVTGVFPRLRERMRQQAGTLSGGEQQMLALGRALMMRPELILLDEPSLGLAPLLVDTIYSSLETLNREGLTILLVEQNVRRALTYSQRAYVLENGEVILQGRSADILVDSAVTSAYLGVPLEGEDRLIRQSL